MSFILKMIDGSIFPYLSCCRTFDPVLNHSKVKLLVLGLLVFFVGCQNREPNFRNYSEKVYAKQTMVSSQTTQKKTELNVVDYTLPEGWSVSAGTGMRLAEFRHGAFNATLIRLDGDGGGIEANLRRWLLQMKVTPTVKEMSDILAETEESPLKNGMMISLVDFSKFAMTENAPAILGAVIRSEKEVYFLKYAGSKKELIRDRESFYELARSINPKSP